MVPVLQTAKLESKETLIILVSSSEMANPVTLPLWNSYSDLIAPFDVSITIILPVSKPAYNSFSDILNTAVLTLAYNEITYLYS